LPPPTTDEVMAAVRGGAASSSALLDQLLDAPVQPFAATVCLLTAAARRMVVDDLLGEAPRPRTMADVRSSRARYRGVIAHLDNALASAREDRARHETMLAQRRRDLARERGRLGSAMHALDQLLRSRARVLRRIEQTITAFRDAHARQGEAVARIEAIEGALSRVRTHLARYEELWLSRVESALATIGGPPPFPGVAFTDVDVGYARLLAALDGMLEMSEEHSARGYRVELDTALLAGIAGVTLRGLGEMLATHSSEVGALAAALAGPGFAWTGPLWGG